MCQHTGLVICFACLFLSLGISHEENIDKNIACNTAQLYEKFSSNGSLSVEGLDQILNSFKNVCIKQNTEFKINNSHTKLEQHNVDPKIPNSVENFDSKTNAWLYAGISVLFISACGLAAVALIKILPTWLFQPSIQFLVALAVGTLTGDAILHLLPHALTTHSEQSSTKHFHSENETDPSHRVDIDHSHDHDDENHAHDPLIVWRGFLILTVIMVFFVIERLLNIFGEWKQRLQSSKQVDKVAHLINESSKTVGEKLCRHHQENHSRHKNHIGHDHSENHSEGGERLLETKANNAPSEEPDTNLLVSCVKEVTFLNKDEDACANAIPNKDHCSHRDEQYKGCHDWQGLVVGKPLIYCASHDICDGSDAITSMGDSQRHTETVLSDHLVSVKAKNSDSHQIEETQSNRPIDSLTVYISEHHTSHHGHSHSHGHIHARPHGLASLAWLVLAGDGLHNLSDGLAIGAAFAANLTGGFTTAFAVLCHELPHELGDFAVLLKAGMTVKQAMICNLISSFLCLLGVLVGLAIGSAHEAAPWIFAATGGMFIYIALVDMMPELNGHANKSRSALLMLAIQLAGMLCGFGIMLAIALNEHEFSRVLKSQLKSIEGRL